MPCSRKVPSERSCQSQSWVRSWELGLDFAQDPGSWVLRTAAHKTHARGRSKGKDTRRTTSDFTRSHACAQRTERWVRHQLVDSIHDR
eukprot:2333183-Prymnesium_polylepis.2